MSNMSEGYDFTGTQAVVFDIGGVLIAGGVDTVRAFGTRHGLHPDD